MKLNYKRTILVGFAFFLISAFWQAYDAIVPLILTNHFGLPQSVSGVVMSVDNILAVFMLPIFGAISDKVMTRYGTLARDGVSREVPCSALKGETVPDSLPATPRSPPTRRVPRRNQTC